MRKIIIVCYYELKDFLASIADIFTKRYRWDVVAYPLYMYCYDKHSKLDNYADHMSEFFKKEKPDAVLWWFTDVSTSVFNRIKAENPSTFFVIYNFSDPINMNNVYLERCAVFDHVITVCQQNLPIYKLQSRNKYIDFLPFGFDKNIFKRYSPQEVNCFDKSYSSDVAFICDSLYTDHTDQIIDRKTLISLLYTYCKSNNLVFNVYGPDVLAHFAKECYKGNLKYSDTPAVATLSKINIITHPDPRKKLGLCNSNLFQILACGGVVLMDRINGGEIFFNKDRKSVFMFDKNDLLSKVSEILSLYQNDTARLEMIRQNAINISQQFSWDVFVEKIYLRFIQDKFDPVFFSRIYRVPSETPVEKMQKIWYDAYRAGEYQIPYPIKVPSNFDIENYRSKFNMKKEDVEDEVVYIDWYVRGKDQDYLKRGSAGGVQLAGSMYGLPTPKLFELFTGFNDIFVKRDVDAGLEKLQQVSKQNPRLKINEALKKYIDISYSE